MYIHCKMFFSCVTKFEFQHPAVFFVFVSVFCVECILQCGHDNWDVSWLWMTSLWMSSMVMLITILALWYESPVLKSIYVHMSPGFFYQKRKLIWAETFSRIIENWKYKDCIWFMSVWLSSSFLGCLFMSPQLARTPSLCHHMYILETNLLSFFGYHFCTAII